MQFEGEREGNEVKEKKINFEPNHAEPPYTRHPNRKRTLRRIK